MANITAQMVKELRDQTGAGMMDCKAALGETAGNLDQAVDWLRKKGLAKAANKAGRVAADGMIADIALTAGTDVDTILKAKVGHQTVADAIAESIAKIGENLTLRRAVALEVGTGLIASYVHSSVAEGLGKIGVLVALESTGNADELKSFGRMLGMHVAASNPLALDSSKLDADLIRREKEVLADKAQQQGKPANVIDKIVESGLKTFYKEVCLLDQPYVHEPDKTVAQAVKAAEAKVGAPIKVTGYVRLKLGEGVDKEKKDFAAEVAAAVAPR
jgi:elongation factor Ts